MAPLASDLATVAAGAALARAAVLPLRVALPALLAVVVTVAAAAQCSRRPPDCSGSRFGPVQEGALREPQELLALLAPQPAAAHPAVGAVAMAGPHPALAWP